MSARNTSACFTLDASTYITLDATPLRFRSSIHIKRTAKYLEIIVEEEQGCQAIPGRLVEDELILDGALGSVT
jgi:hypothetical protein